MKILNIFKKETKKVVKSTIQNLEKNQLEKVIGGGDETSEGGVNNTPHKRPGTI